MQSGPMNSSLRLSLTLAAAISLSACTTQRTGPGGSRPPGAGQSPSGGLFGNLFGSGLSPSLEPQRERLKQALDGTPVVIEATGDHRLRVTVPTRNSFEPGRATVKPALGAVLEQLAVGFRPYAATTELRIGAPADDKASDRLIQERAASVRDELITRGVPASRIVDLGRSPTPGLEIVLSDRPLNK